jgi:zinc D-Ala-D-Ala carboxypeptidase
MVADAPRSQAGAMDTISRPHSGGHTSPGVDTPPRVSEQRSWPRLTDEVGRCFAGGEQAQRGAGAGLGLHRLLATFLALSAAIALPALAQRSWGGRIEPEPPAELPACTFGDTVTPHADYTDWDRTLLDTQYRLPAVYVPPDLVALQAGERRVVVRSFVVPDLRSLLDAARRDGIGIRLNSGFRSHAEQAALFARLAGGRGERRARAMVARPGHSEHQLGTTVDLAGDHAWLAANAWRFGFVMSYPPGRSPHFTCYGPEPWHYRYFGRERAVAIHSSGLSPREFLWRESQRLGLSTGALQAGGDAAYGEQYQAQHIVASRIVFGEGPQSPQKQDLHLGK